MSQEKETVLKQYADAANLSMRIKIHQLYSTNKQDFHHWVFEQMDFRNGDCVVEFGSGPGTFWSKNASNLPESLNVTLTDLSPGMVKELKQNVDHFLHGTYHVMDIQNPELESDIADVVITNHMLYHVPNLHSALKEVNRVLKPSGRFYASTNGLRHMAELGEWLTEYDSSIAPGSTDFLKSFALETGGSLLEHYFSNVRLVRFDCNLKVTNIDHLLGYYESMDLGIELNDDFRSFLETKRVDGAFHITKAGGLFISEKE